MNRRKGNSSSSSFSRKVKFSSAASLANAATVLPYKVQNRKKKLSKDASGGGTLPPLPNSKEPLISVEEGRPPLISQRSSELEAKGRSSLLSRTSLASRPSLLSSEGRASTAGMCGRKLTPPKWGSTASQFSMPVNYDKKPVLHSTLKGRSPSTPERGSSASAQSGARMCLGVPYDTDAARGSFTFSLDSSAVNNPDSSADECVDNLAKQKMNMQLKGVSDRLYEVCGGIFIIIIKYVLFLSGFYPVGEAGKLLPQNVQPPPKKTTTLVCDS